MSKSFASLPNSLASLTAATILALMPFAAEAQNRPPALPEGEAKVLVEGLCTLCHQTNMITASMGYTRDGWKELTSTMLDLSGNEDMREKLVSYLATHFPPNTRRAPTIVPGPVQISLKEWVMPHLGQRSRDPIQAADGLIWFAGQFGNLMGSINPATGEIKEWPSPSGPKSHPYAIAVVDGIVWYNESGMRPDPLVRFDPATETFQSWAIPSGNIYAGIIRHMRPARDGSLLIHQSSTNRIIQVTVSRRAAAR